MDESLDQCSRCNTRSFQSDSGTCQLCGLHTSGLPGSQEHLASRHIRGVIFRRLSADARSGVKFVAYSLEQAAFERIFIAGQEQSDQTVLVSDSEEDEEQLVCLKKRILLTSFQQVQDFAGFHDLEQPKIQQHGPCRNSKVLQRSGEVAVLVPPLTAAWHRTAEGISKATIVFSWAVMNSAGNVRLSACRAEQAIWLPSKLETEVL